MIIGYIIVRLFGGSIVLDFLLVRGNKARREEEKSDHLDHIGHVISSIVLSSFKSYGTQSFVLSMYTCSIFSSSAFPDEHTPCAYYAIPKNARSIVSCTGTVWPTPCALYPTSCAVAVVPSP